MRPELEQLQQIDKYLNNEYSAADRAAFEARLAADPNIREELRLQSDLRAALQRATLTSAIRRARLKHYRSTFLKWGGIVLVIGLVILLVTTSRLHHRHTAVPGISSGNHQATTQPTGSGTSANPTQPVPGQPSYGNGSLPAANETGQSRWSAADSNLPAQTFWLSGAHDTVIETSAGIVLSIPAGAFIDANHQIVTGTVELVIKEALDPATILKAGLSTRAGDRLLETGGMFFVDARQNGKPLRIDPAHAIYAEIPTGSVRSGMQLFTGKRLAGGTIDWTDPRPLEHDLLPVDIHLLDFYPPHFLDSVTAWGYDRANKIFTDSLYYAFSYLFDGSNSTRNAAFSRLCGAIEVAPVQSNAFGTPLRDSIGPWLAPARRSFLQDVISFIYRTHPRLNLRSRQSSTGSNPTTGQSTAGQSPTFAYPAIADTSRPTIADTSRAAVADSSRAQHTGPDTAAPDTAAPSWCTINPAKIAAIWNDHFQNTLLATREFEQRLILIHQTGDNNLLDLYVDHLDLGLSAIDSIAARRTTGWVQRQFLTFSALHDGKVRHGDTRFAKLREYYQKKEQAFAAAIAKTTAEFWDRERQLDDTAANLASAHGRDSAERLARNFAQELDANVRSAYRQLGYTTTSYRVDISNAGYKDNITNISYKANITTASYRANITNTGWCNIDRYVMYASQQTYDRQTIDFRDASTGKHAVIAYSSVYFKFQNIREYDRIYLYLLPDKLSSFMRLTDSAGIFTEKLNSEMTYRLVVIAYQQEQAFYYAQSNIQATTYTPIPLIPVSTADLDNRLQQLGNAIQVADLTKDQEYFHFESHDRQRRDRDQQLRDLTNKMINAFFSCMLEGSYENVKPPAR